MGLLTLNDVNVWLLMYGGCVGCGRNNNNFIYSQHERASLLDSIFHLSQKFDMSLLLLLPLCTIYVYNKFKLL